MISKRAFVSGLASLPFVGLFVKKAQAEMLPLAADFKVVEYEGRYIGDGIELKSMSMEEGWLQNARAQHEAMSASEVEFIEGLRNLRKQSSY